MMYIVSTYFSHTNNSFSGHGCPTRSPCSSVAYASLLSPNPKRILLEPLNLTRTPFLLPENGPILTYLGGMGGGSRSVSPRKGASCVFACRVMTLSLILRVDRLDFDQRTSTSVPSVRSHHTITRSGLPFANAPTSHTSDNSPISPTQRSS